ncbi:MAG TPA: alpha/beta hydrolase [Egibacteraceae bacterium]
MTTLTTHRVEVPDGHLVVDVAGQGPPVVLLHAGGMQRVMWDHEMGWLAERATAIRCDARGNGDASTPMHDYSPSADLVAVLDALDVERAVLVGVSLGARTGLETGLEHPQRVAGLLLGGPGVHGMVFDDPGLAEARRQRDEALAALDAQRWVDAFLVESVDGPARRPEDVDPQVRRWCWDTVLDTVRRHGHGTGQPIAVEVLDRLGEVAVPATVVSGRWDSVDVQRVADRLTADLPDVERVDLDTGHMPNLEDPAGFRAAVEGLLARVEGW